MNKHTKDVCGRPNITTEPIFAPLATGAQLRPPETYRLPPSGGRDPFFSLSRAYYYEAEKAGMIRLIRLRKKGNLRGVTLVRFSDVAELVQRAASTR